MLFIELENTDNKIIYLNVSQVVEFYRDGPHTSIVSAAPGMYPWIISVKQHPDTILALIGEAQSRLRNSGRF